MLTRHISMVVQTGSGAQPASYPTGTGGSFHGGKAVRGVADHSPPSSVEVNKGQQVLEVPSMEVKRPGV
jgi:hypothetical protein